MSTRRLFAWLAVAALLAAPYLAPSSPSTSHPVGAWRELAASIDWVRFQRARLNGRPDLAVTHAERALRRAPHVVGGWSLLADYLGFELASAQTETDAARRLHWIRAAAQVTRDGEEQVAHPEELALVRGLLFAAKADETGTADAWPGGAEALWAEAERAFTQAAELGSASASELAEHARLARSAAD